MDYLETFLKELYVYLTGKPNNKTNIVRLHTRKLQECGELSFPLYANSWCSLIAKIDAENCTIFEFLNANEENNTNKLISTSQSWILHINKCEIVNNNVIIYLDRAATFKSIVEVVFNENVKYGSNSLCKAMHVSVECDGLNTDLSINLSELRLKLLIQVSKNLITFCEGIVVNNQNKPDLCVNFSLKSSGENKTCFCGSVLNKNGVKDVITTADDFYKQRTLDMRLMAEHKYGLRIISKPGWEDFFKKLGDAAVTIELLRNKPNQTLSIDINNQLLASSKGAPFILYNCARLAMLFKEFDKKVLSNNYPKLPGINEIDFNNLTQPEEWDLLFIHILQFPNVIRNCMRDSLDGKVYPNCLIAALSSMVLCFSVYYRRVKILTEPRPHVFPVLHARIYLLKALEQVLHNGLRLLDIEPVKQM